MQPYYSMLRCAVWLLAAVPLRFRWLLCWLSLASVCFYVNWIMFADHKSCIIMCDCMIWFLFTAQNIFFNMLWIFEMMLHKQKHLVCMKHIERVFWWFCRWQIRHTWRHWLQKVGHYSCILCCAWPPCHYTGVGRCATQLPLCMFVMVLSHLLWGCWRRLIFVNHFVVVVMDIYLLGHVITQFGEILWAIRF